MLFSQYHKKITSAVDEYLEWDCPAGVPLCFFRVNVNLTDNYIIAILMRQCMVVGSVGLVWQNIIKNYLQRDHPAGVLKSFCRVNVILTDHCFLLLMQRQCTMVGLAGLSSSAS